MCGGVCFSRQTPSPTRLGFLEADRVQELRQHFLIHARGEKSCRSQGSWRASLEIGIGDYPRVEAEVQEHWTKSKGELRVTVCPCIPACLTIHRCTHLVYSCCNKAISILPSWSRLLCGTGTTEPKRVAQSSAITRPRHGSPPPPYPEAKQIKKQQHQ